MDEKKEVTAHGRAGIQYSMQKIRAAIHLKKIRENAKLFATKSGVRLCAVVKANAYGHGAEEVVAALSGVADCFAVAIVEEGLAIRGAACGKDVLVFTPPITKEQAFAIACNGFIGTVSDIQTAQLFLLVCEQYRLQVKVHLKVNTGMNRYGMDVRAVSKICRLLQGTRVQVTGVYSHLYDRKSAQWQRELFLQAERACKAFYPTACAHLSATQGALLGERFSFDMVRVGIGLYGYVPKDCGVRAQDLGLRKAMTVYAQAIGSRSYRFGGAGYGEVTDLAQGEQTTLLRVGYADGFLRNRENGLIGKNRNVLCMDACIQTGTKNRGEWVCIMSDAEKTAATTGTIPYEVLCAATRRAECVYDYE